MCKMNLSSTHAYFKKGDQALSPWLCPCAPPTVRYWEVNLRSILHLGHLDLSNIQNREVSAIYIFLLVKSVGTWPCVDYMEVSVIRNEVPLYTYGGG